MMLRVFNYNTLEKVKTFLLFLMIEYFFKMQQLFKSHQKARGVYVTCMLQGI